MLVVIVVAVSSSGNKGNQLTSSPGYSSAPSKPAMSQYEQAIPSLDPQVGRLLEGMLTALQSSDFLLAGNNALTVEKLAKASSQGAKPQVKEARAQNALGLKALKSNGKKQRSRTSLPRTRLTLVIPRLPTTLVRLCMELAITRQQRKPTLPLWHLRRNVHSHGLAWGVYLLETARHRRQLVLSVWLFITRSLQDKCGNRSSRSSMMKTTTTSKMLQRHS